MILKIFTLQTAELNTKSWSKNIDVAVLLMSYCQIFLTAGAECNIIGYGGDILRM